ncbi:ROK family protein [Planktotalea arctica]|uniref:glucokinase n=1 Tax=Planktotalea arctica TaxID=1481893 RepID=UPI0032199495
MKHDAPLILAADIGGTNTRLALLDGTQLRAASVSRYANAKADSLEEILRNYLGAQGTAPDAVSLALAGPVTGDHGRLTNLDWSITTQGASEATGGAKAFLLNDLQAQGHALPYLGQSALTHVQCAAPQCGEPAANAQAPCLMIGLGTGMNVAPVHRLGARTYVPPAEAGHTSFAPQDQALKEFNTALAARIGHVASEDVLSGRGLEHAYLHTAGAPLPAVEIMALCAAGDAPALSAAALVIRALGHFAGDMALTHLPRGGVYLVGGVARALAPYFDDLGFAASFAAKGRFSDFMAQFAVHVVKDDYAALIGAASYAQECIGAREQPF